MTDKITQRDPDAPAPYKSGDPVDANGPTTNFYYVRDGMVWKSPIRTPRGEDLIGHNLTLGFPVCTPSPYVEDQADSLARAFAEAEAFDDIRKCLADAMEIIRWDAEATGRDYLLNRAKAALARAPS